MTQDAYMSEFDIQVEILKSSRAMENIKSFVAELERQGVFELFISKSAFDAFISTLAEEKCFHEQYTMLEISSSDVVDNFILYYVQLVARYMQVNKFCAGYDTAWWVKQLIDLDRDPNNIMSVYMTLLEFSYKVSQKYNDAVGFHFLIKEKEYSEADMNTKTRRAASRKLLKLESKLHVMMTDAFPCGTRETVGSQNWIKQNRELYEKINFGSIILECPYEAIQAYFDASQSELLITDKPKNVIRERQTELFKGILLDDVLSRIRSKKDKTEVVINEAMHALYRKCPIFVHIRMVQSCYMFYRLEYLEREEERLVYMFSQMPELFSQSNLGGINIPS